MEKYQNIIWDWNGTLLNDLNLCIDIVNELAKNHRDTYISKQAYTDGFGFPIIESYRRIGFDFEKESFDVLTQKFIQSYQSKISTCVLHENARNTLTHFQDLGKQQFILTAAHKKDVLKLIAFYGINKYFEAIEGLDNHKAASKVAQGIKLLEKENINRSVSVLIGDTLHDYEVAQAMGINCILIANGHQSKDRLVAHTEGKIEVLDHIDQLLKKT